jgi:hypothetical protein
MGATGSRSSPTGKTTTRLVTISRYSQLVRTPVLQPRTFDTIFFDHLYWDVTLKPWEFNDGLAHSIWISVVLGDESRYCPDLVLKGIDISIEILDETANHTVFRSESNESTLQACKSLLLGVFRRELEASSCLRDDSFTVRCTMSKQRSTMWRLFSEPKKLAPLDPHVAMAGSHMLTVGSFSKLKAALRGGECTYSTHFAVGGCTWFFQFCPTGVFALTRDITNKARTTTEFSFELEGAIKFESEKITHTFSYSSSRYIYRCRLDPSTSAMQDPLIVRCQIAVIMAEKPSLPPAATQTATTPRTRTTTTTPRIESIVTPLLSAIYK